jgi:hypothetical protein
VLPISIAARFVVRVCVFMLVGVNPWLRPQPERNFRMTIEIRKALTRADAEAVFRLRYEVYVEELARVQHFADHDARMIIEPLDVTAHLIGAFEDGRAVGTVRSNYARDSDLSDYESLYDMQAVGRDHPRATAVTTKLLVARAYRSTTLGYRLASAGYRAHLLAGIEHDFIDVYPARVPFFEKLGYRPHRAEVSHPEYGVVAVMRLSLRDESHLRSVRSPFLQHLLRPARSAA